MFVAEYIASEELRREIHEGSQVVENWNSANTDLFYGSSGTLGGSDSEHQEVSMLFLHLLQSALVFINTLLVQSVLKDPAWQRKMTAADGEACPRCSGPTPTSTEPSTSRWTATSTSASQSDQCCGQSVAHGHQLAGRGVQADGRVSLVAGDGEREELPSFRPGPTRRPQTRRAHRPLLQRRRPQLHIRTLPSPWDQPQQGRPLPQRPPGPYLSWQQQPPCLHMSSQAHDPEAAALISRESSNPRVSAAQNSIGYCRISARIWGLTCKAFGRFSPVSTQASA